MTKKRHTHHNFGFIAGTLLGIGWELWTNRDQNISFSKPHLKKIIHEFTDKIPDHVDYLVDKICDQENIQPNLSSDPISTTHKTKAIHKSPQNFLTKISSFFKI